MALKPRIVEATLAAALIACSAGAAAAQTVDFAGKTITIYIGYTAGGSYDLYGRLVARHLGAHLPGRPTVVAENMPGAGSLKAANYLYKVAPRDGTALGVVVEPPRSSRRSTIRPFNTTPPSSPMWAASPPATISS